VHRVADVSHHDLPPSGARGRDPGDPGSDRAGQTSDAYPAADAAVPDGLRVVAADLFGSGLALAERYAGRLVTDGVVRGLIGPREAPRIWDRHLLNCVAIAPLIPEGSYVVDVGSGAGLPGIALAIARPDLAVVLVDSLARRTVFLDEVVDALDLQDRVTVLRARAEEIAATPAMFHVKHCDVVTARAVAPLDRLAGWCLPLAKIGGRLLALKGASAADEVAEHGAAVARLGGSPPEIIECGSGVLPEATIVVSIIRERAARSAGASRRQRP
jgi:16S rRNA (guanine527-N7)-methyltransferase